MNEPSSFVNGTTTNQCRNTELNYPPYFPGTHCCYNFDVIMLLSFLYQVYILYDLETKIHIPNSHYPFAHWTTPQLITNII